VMFLTIVPAAPAVAHHVVWLDTFRPVRKPARRTQAPG
jgi:hypothetical protein